MIAGLALACAIALIAKSRRTLSLSGAIAAVFVATACTAAGWSWAWMLVAFFVTSTLLSKFRESKKRSRTGDIVEKGGERDAWQVLANGGVFAATAILSIVWPSSIWWSAGAGAIGTAIADTWATEIGTLSRHGPRSILSGKPVPPGTSGGVTLAGFLGGIAGALSMVAIAAAFGWPARVALAAAVGGIFGMSIDSILGAAIQEKRWCDRCGRETERAVHSCGTVTVHHSGVRWISNDVVNLASSMGGAIVGIVWLR